MSTTTDLTTLKINYLTQAQYDAEAQGGTINENALYLTPAESSDVITPTITATTGTLVNAWMGRYGKVRTLLLAVKNSASVAAGSSVFEGSIADNRPISTCFGIGYYSSSLCAIRVQPEGGIVVRAHIGTIPANAEVYVYVTYIVS